MADINQVVDRAEQRIQSSNPFQRPAQYSDKTILAYKIGTIVVWLLFVTTGAYYTFEAPESGGHARRTIWGQNKAHPTPFSLNALITSIYWIVLLFLQIPYMAALYSTQPETMTHAAHLAPNFINSTVLNFIFVHLWTRSYLWVALIITICNFLNLSIAYLSLPLPTEEFAAEVDVVADSETGRVREVIGRWAKGYNAPPFDFKLLIHSAAVAGPLAFSFVALYWVGAAAFNAHSLAARILANIAIWGILVYGLFHIVVFGDWVLAFALSVLCASLGVHQFLVHIVALQWIFAFVIMSILFSAAMLAAAPKIINDSAERILDEERAPLLANDVVVA